MTTRLVAFGTFATGTVSLAFLAHGGYPVVGVIAFVAASCASLIVSVVAFARDPDEWPDVVRRFPPD